MMNKKAIAAFAAGATLLAGFAMATPAFAAEGPKAPATKAQLVDAAKKAWADYAAAKAALDKMTKPAENAPAAPATPAGVADLVEADATAGEGMLKLKATTTKEGTTTDKYEAAVGYRDSVNNYYKGKKAYEDQVKKVNDLLTAYAAANAAAEGHADDPSEDDTKDAAIARVRTAKADLDTKRVKKSKTYAEYLKKKSALRAAKDAYDRQDQAVKDAEAALEKFDMSGKTDSAARENLQKRYDRAVSLRSAAALKVAKAQGEYDDAEAKATDAREDWKLAVKEYEAAYEAAVALGVNPATLPLVSTAEDPLENDFSDVPGALKVVEDAKAGKFGPEAQAAAQKPGAQGAAAAGKAGAAAATKGEVEKGGKGRGKAPVTGVGVTLTALAATMLAGMGAAVRKARH